MRVYITRHEAFWGMHGFTLLLLAAQSVWHTDTGGSVPPPPVSVATLAFAAVGYSLQSGCRDMIHIVIECLYCQNY